MTEFDFDEVPDMSGAVAVVTGAKVGLGFETTIGLTKKNITVIMACRDLKKAQSAKSLILARVPNAKLDIIKLDLSSFASVREFVSTVLSTYDRLDLLINNAGIMIPEFDLTEDNLESQMGVNYFGHFLLTNLLMPLIKKQPHSRIVSVSSIAHEKGAIDFDNLNSEISYKKFDAYRQSKLACLMFAYELQRHIDFVGGSVVSVAAHPGVTNTNLARHIPRFLYYALLPLTAPFRHSVQRAVQPILMAALAPNVNGGEYFGPKGLRGMKGLPGKITSKPHSYNKEVAEKLWEESELITGEIFMV